MKNLNRLAILSLNIMLMAGIVPQLTYAAPAATASAEQYAPGVLLNQSREYLRQEELRRELENEKKKLREGVTETKKAPDKSQDTVEQTIILHDIVHTGSEVILPEVWDKLTAPYREREVKIGDLYDVVNNINKYYSDNGYVTCRAFLPKQKIENGVLTIRLIEGKTGNIEVKGAATTRPEHILNRVELEKGRVDNVNDLNDSLLWYNGTNDVQLRIALQAGVETGTTDYIITAYEPKRDTYSLFVDNSGSENTGLWREGLSYSNRSLTGNRDQLLISTMRSQGTKSGFISYSLPLSDRGLRFGAQFSANSMEIVKGLMKQINTRGHSKSYGFSLTQPLAVDKKKKIEASLEWGNQDSRMDVGEGLPWLDDDITRKSVAVTSTHYGHSGILYHRHSLTGGRWENIGGGDTDYDKYTMNFIAQRLYDNRQLLSIRGSVQHAFDDYLPSADQFYIGGVYSVRGYEENMLGADNGFTLSVEYTVPDRANSEWVWFFDHGRVSGENSFNDHVLNGVGVGYKMNIAQAVSASLTLGVPLEREVNGAEVSKTRLHFMMNGSL